MKSRLRSRRSAAICLLFAIVLMAGLWASRLPTVAHAAGMAQDGTDYPIPIDTPIQVFPTQDGDYPPPSQGTTPTTPAMPTEDASPTVSVTGGPNLFLTENAQMGDSLSTPAGEQTFLPTRTATFTITPNTTPLTETTITPTPPPGNGATSPLLWGLAGVIMPFVILSFSFLGIHLARAVKSAQ